jgi:hypothetical protein
MFESLVRPKQKVYALDVVLRLFPLLHALSGGEGRERRAFKYCVCFFKALLSPTLSSTKSVEEREARSKEVF